MCSSGALESLSEQDTIEQHEQAMTETLTFLANTGTIAQVTKRHILANRPSVSSAPQARDLPWPSGNHGSHVQRQRPGCPCVFRATA
eukprot:11381998-Alexandrium_andersonii.AAC.1